MASDTNTPEQAPLLSNTPSQGYNGTQDHPREDTSQDAKKEIDYSAAASRYILKLCIILLIFNFVQFSGYAPLTAVMEDIICKSYYSSGESSSLDEYDCKTAPVQRELAFVKGYKDTLSQIPSKFPSSY